MALFTGGTIIRSWKLANPSPCEVLEEKAYPSASGNAECCGDVGEFVVEQIANLLTVHGRYDRLSPLLDRVPTAFRRRGCLRSVSYRAALA